MMEQCKIVVCRGNGAVTLTFLGDRHPTLREVADVMPGARHCYPYRTFDGDAYMRVQLTNEDAYRHGLTVGAPFSWLMR